MLPLIYQQIEATGLIPVEEFPDILAMSQMTPGPIAINAATYVGFRSLGLAGAFIATLGVLTPSIILILLLLTAINRSKKSLLIKNILDGVRPVTVGMIFIAVVYFLEISALNGKILSTDILEMGGGFFNIIPAFMFLGVITLAIKTKINPILITISAGLIGALLL